MNQCRNFLKEKWMYIAALIIPGLVAVVHSLIVGSWIIGNGNIAVGDMALQYIPVSYEIWDSFHNGGMASFTWHLLDGMSYDTVVSQQMNSPFIWIMLLLPRKAIPSYMQFLMIAKLSLCSLTMTCFFYKTRFNNLKERKKIISLFLGIAFALSNGMMSFIIYVHFMDAIICFPLLLLLTEKLVMEKKWKLYYIVLTYTIWTNMYISFQICVFLAIWFFLNLSMETSERVKSSLLFAGVSLLSGSTLFGIIINGLNWATNRNELAGDGTKEVFLDALSIKPYDFIKQLLSFRDISLAKQVTPNIYFSVTALIFVFLFVFINIDIKKKIYLLATAIVLTASFFIGSLNLFWHLFTVPNGLYHRFMYIFSFFMLFIVLLTIQKLEDTSLLVFSISTVVLITIYIYSLLHINENDSVISYFVSGMIIVFIYLMIFFYKRGSIHYKNVILIISVCGIIEIMTNALVQFDFYDGDQFYGKDGIVDTAVELLSQAELGDGERIANIVPMSNIGMVTGLNSDSGFVSVLNTKNRLLHELLGMCCSSSVEFGSRGASPLVNLLFNIRYGIGESEMLFSDAEKVAENGDDSLFRIKRLAGLGFMVRPSILEWNSLNKNCFQFQNDFIDKATGGEDIFSPVTMDLNCSDYNGDSIEPLKDYIESGVYWYNYKSKYGNEYDACQLEVTMKQDADLYMFLKGTYYEIYIMIDGETVHMDKKGYMQSTYHIGNVKEGQKITIIGIPQNIYSVGIEMQMIVTFGEFHEEAYQKAYEVLNSNAYNIDSWEPDDIKGTIHVDEAGIMMTSIPITEGFNVYVDGKKTDIIPVIETMIGVNLEKGDHIVEFKYEPPKQVPDKVAMLISFMIYMVICYYDYYKKKHSNANPL